jgi:hypothetical protein
MAKIPAGEGFGEVVARPVRQEAPPRAAFGAAVANAVVETGNEISNEAARMRAAEDAEARRQAERARATAEAAKRAKATMQVQTVEADLDLITDEVAEGVRTGSIGKDQASEEFKRRTQERMKTGLEGLPPEHLEIAQMGVNNRVTRLSRTVGKAVTQRNQSDVRAGIDAQMEYAQRLYVSEPAKADAMIASTFESLGPHSGLDAAQLGKLQQTWREGTRLNKAQSLVQMARTDNKALDAVATRLTGDEFADVDPSRKTAILGQIEGFKVSNIQKAEAAQRAAQARQEAALRKAEAAFTAANSLTAQGKPLSQEYVAQVSAATAGTPFAAAFKESLAVAPANTAFGVQPLAVQERILQDQRAQLLATGTDPKVEKRYSELEKIHQQAKREYEEDPLLAAAERGVIPQVAPLDTSSVAGLLKSVGQRTQQADIVRQQVGAPVSPLVKQEAAQVAKLIEVLPADQRATAVAEIASAMGPQQAAALSRQMGPKNKALAIAFGLAGSKTTNGRYTSELVLRGAQAIKDRAVKEDNSALTGIRAQVAAEIGDAVQGPARDDLIDAAVLTYYGKQSEGNASLKEAVRLATGGITERGGRKIVLPYGVKEDDFDTRLRGMQPGAFAGQAPDGQVYAGGAPVPLADFVKQLPDASLVTVGNGKYHVRAGGSLVTNKARRPIVVEVR